MPRNLDEAVAGVRRIAALSDVNTTGPSATRVLEDAARARGIQLSIHPVARPEEIGAAIEAAKPSRAEALNVLGSALLFNKRPIIWTELVAAVGYSSAQSLYRRFFGVRRHFTEQEIAFFMNLDFIDHVALVVVTEEHGRPEIIGGGRYVVLQPEKAEIAFAVVDEYQGQGIGAALTGTRKVTSLK